MMDSKSNAKQTERTSGVYAFQDNFTWEGIEKESYNQTEGTAKPFDPTLPQKSISRQMLFGGRGEQGDFEVRYFELPPGGSTNFEHHEEAPVF